METQGQLPAPLAVGPDHQIRNLEGAFCLKLRTLKTIKGLQKVESNMTFFEGFSRPRSCAAPPAAAAEVRKNGMERLHAPASATGAPIFLSRRQSPRRLGKNQGYETKIGGVGLDSRSGVRGTRTAQRPAKAAHPLAPGVPVAAAWSPSASGTLPPRPAARPDGRNIFFYISQET